MSLKALFAHDASEVAAKLIGAYFTVHGVGGTIVETEAYAADDEASHSFKGQTSRNSVMFGHPADVYVYRSYGLHWCLNFVCLTGSAVLVRAIEPAVGLQAMHARRQMQNNRLLCSGPGRLCQALGITGDHNGLSLDQPIFSLTFPKTRSPLSCGRRIGISKAIDVHWRFGLKGSKYLSRPFPG